MPDKHISQDPSRLMGISDDMRKVREGIFANKISVENGDVIARAGFVECKAIETDLKARLFAHKIDVLEVNPAPAIAAE